MPAARHHVEVPRPWLIAELGQLRWFHRGPAKGWNRRAPAGGMAVSTGRSCPFAATHHRLSHRLSRVESECGAAAVGPTYLLPPLSSGGASLVRPWLRFHTPLIERSRRISRTALSDKTSRLHPRRAAAEPGQTYEPEVPVEVREWIAPALASPALVLEPQPPAQPHSHVCVERAIRLAGGADTEVIGPPAEHAVQLVYELCGLLPGTRADGQRVDGFDHALDALL